MAFYKGRLGSLFIWDGTVSALSDEPCTVVTNTAQITDTDKQLLSPNHVQTFTDDGTSPAVVEIIDYLTATAQFNKSVVGAVTVDGSYIAAGSITEVGQIYSWKMDSSMEIIDGTSLQDTFKRKITGLGDYKGTIDGFWLNEDFFEMHQRKVVGGVPIELWYLKLYVSDVDSPSSKLGFRGFVILNGISTNTPVAELVKESITFEGYQSIAFFDES